MDIIKAALLSMVFMVLISLVIGFVTVLLPLMGMILTPVIIFIVCLVFIKESKQTYHAPEDYNEDE